MKLLDRAKGLRLTTEQVKAVLNGTKTEHRIPIKPQPKEQLKCVIQHETGGMACWMEENANQLDSNFRFYKSLEVGDVIYVRETWEHIESDDLNPGRFIYRASPESVYPIFEETIKWRPSITMPKEAARIFLKVTEVKVERVQDIEEEGAYAEGFRADDTFGAHFYFCEAWDEIYKSQGLGWDNNPWVWVIKFEVVKEAE